MEQPNQESFPESMNEYRRQLEIGDIQEAYQGLMGYFGDLRSHFNDNYPDFAVSKSIYYGYMDMTFISLFPESLKRRQLKIPIVFIHDTFGFEVWLSGANRSVQSKYWKLLKESGWDKYQLASDPEGYDYVIDHQLVDNPDFSDLYVLTKQIERGTLEFIGDVERFFAKQNV